MFSPYLVGMTVNISFISYHPFHESFRETRIGEKVQMWESGVQGIRRVDASVGQFASRLSRRETVSGA